MVGRLGMMGMTKRLGTKGVMGRLGGRCPYDGSAKHNGRGEALTRPWRINVRLDNVLTSVDLEKVQKVEQPRGQSSLD